MDSLRTRPVRSKSGRVYVPKCSKVDFLNSHDPVKAVIMSLKPYFIYRASLEDAENSIRQALEEKKIVPGTDAIDAIARESYYSGENHRFDMSDPEFSDPVNQIAMQMCPENQILAKLQKTEPLTVMLFDAVTPFVQDRFMQVPGMLSVIGAIKEPFAEAENKIFTSRNIKESVRAFLSYDNTTVFEGNDPADLIARDQLSTRPFSKNTHETDRSPLADEVNDLIRSAGEGQKEITSIQK